MSDLVSRQTLQEMRSYYNERAREYDEWFYCRGRYDRGPKLNACWFAEVEEVVAALEVWNLEGDILELAPGTWLWTERLVHTASTLTAVDASDEMIAINRARVHSERVAYVLGDLFTWRPDRLYDAVFFGFWLSHVPLERPDALLSSVTGVLRPGGKLFFVDSRREPTSTAADHQLSEPDSQVMTRILNDGRTFEIMKNFYGPDDLPSRCLRAGLEVTVRDPATYFLYGYGIRR